MKRVESLIAPQITNCNVKWLILHQVKTSLLAALATNTAPASLQVHNKYRALHHSPPLNWSEGLANEASRIAQSLATQSTLSEKKDTALNLGQNLAKLAGK